jgi:hypothetical protein
MLFSVMVRSVVWEVRPANPNAKPPKIQAQT